MISSRNYHTIDYLKELDLKNIQNIELEILKEFALICSELDLRYSLGGGTLLGAIRHKGFIPWDDDIDIMMPRPDYNQLIKHYSSNNTRFELICHETCEGYSNLFGKIYDPNTVIIDNNIQYETIPIGVHIDVFPIDGLADTYVRALFQFLKTALFRELLNARSWKQYFVSKTHGFYYEPIRLILYVISRFFTSKQLIGLIEMINQSKSFDDSVYSGCVSGSYRLKEIMKSSVFSHFYTCQFEDTYFSVICEYDSYLKKHYGDYMTIPPRTNQVTHHSFNAFINDLE